MFWSGETQLWPVWCQLFWMPVSLFLKYGLQAEERSFISLLWNSQKILCLTRVMMVPLYTHVEVILLLWSLPPPRLYLPVVLSILLLPWNSVFLSIPGGNMRNAAPQTATLHHRKVLLSFVWGRLSNPLGSSINLGRTFYMLFYIIDMNASLGITPEILHLQ